MINRFIDNILTNLISFINIIFIIYNKINTNEHVINNYFYIRAIILS